MEAKLEASRGARSLLSPRLRLTETRCRLLLRWVGVHWAHWVQNVYCFPSDADRVLKIDCATQHCSLIGPSFIGQISHNCTLPTVRRPPLNCSPLHAAAHAVTCTPYACSPDGIAVIGLNKWQNGFLGKDCAVYGIPCNAERVLRICCITGEVALIGHDLTDLPNKWEGGVVDRDGQCTHACTRACTKISPTPSVAARRGPMLLQHACMEQALPCRR